MRLWVSETSTEYDVLNTHSLASNSVLRGHWTFRRQSLTSLWGWCVSGSCGCVLCAPCDVNSLPHKLLPPQTELLSHAFPTTMDQSFLPEVYSVRCSVVMEDRMIPHNYLTAPSSCGPAFYALLAPESEWAISLRNLVSFQWEIVNSALKI